MYLVPIVITTRVMIENNKCIRYTPGEIFNRKKRKLVCSTQIIKYLYLLRET